MQQGISPVVSKRDLLGECDLFCNLALGELLEVLVVLLRDLLCLCEELLCTLRERTGQGVVTTSPMMKSR